MESQNPCPDLIIAPRPVPATGKPLWLAETNAWIDRFYDRIDRIRQRRQLRALPDHLLHDIGVSRYDAEREGRKPFWRD